MFSSLCTLVNESPYYSDRQGSKIDRLTPHCFVGQVTARRGLDVFKHAAKDPVSANYVIGYDGSIGGCVDETRRAWTSSNRANDTRAITFEIASGVNDPYVMTDEAFISLISLTIDIMRRHGKNKLVYIPDKIEALNYVPKSNEMLITFHKWFANKACPGRWFIEHCNEYVKRVNDVLKLDINDSIESELCNVDIRVCKLGDENETVKTLQTLLKAMGFKGSNKKVLALDGKFGSNTDYALREYQKTFCKPDGVAGPVTWNKLING